MEKPQQPIFYKRPIFLLILILAAFFLKGVFLAAVFPIFSGQDEARHYSAIQYLAEPTDKTWDLKELPERDDDNLETYGFSEEVQKTATATDTHILRGEIFNTIGFSDGSDGKNEEVIHSMPWKPYNFNLKPDNVGGGKLYHPAAALIEKALVDQDILVRFYSLRIISVLLGTLAVLFFYLTAKTIGFSEKTSLLLTAIVSFQPKFSMYGASITYDALLIPAFFLFTLAGAMAFKNGLDWKNSTLLIISATLGFLAKLTGFVLIAVLVSIFIYFIYQKIKTRNKNIRYITYILCASSFLFLFSYIKDYLPGAEQSLAQLAGSLGKYLDKSLTFGRFGLSARTYWGALGWTDGHIMDGIVEAIKYIEIISLAGLGIFFFSKKERPAYLPEKKYIAFFVFMVIALQLEIRVADWSIFNQSGALGLGTPGRYFLPNLSAHIILIFTGLGALFAYFKRGHYFEKSLVIGAISMLYFSTYLIFNAIILRYYL